jgi:hypothetical protein
MAFWKLVQLLVHSPTIEEPPSPRGSVTLVDIDTE